MTHKAIFENLLLTDEAKVQLEEAFSTAIQAKTVLLEAEFKERESTLQEEILGTVQDLVSEALSEELDVLAEELSHARSLDVEYAEKLEMFKESYAEAQDDVIKVLVAEAVAEEVGELLEDVQFAKENAFGNQLFEAFKDMFEANFGGADIDVVTQLRNTELQLEAFQRKEALETLLEGIGGKERKVFESLLEGVTIGKLEDRFNSVKSIVLRESVTSATTDAITAPIVESQLIVESGDKAALMAAFNSAINISKRKMV